MIKRFVIIWIIGCALLNPTASASPIKNLVVEGKSYQNTASIFLENGTLYLPIQEFLRTLKLELHYSPKHHLYQLKRGKKTVFFAPFSDYVVYEGKTHYLKASPLIRDNRIYVPINEFTPFLNISGVVANKSLIFSKKMSKSQPDRLTLQLDESHKKAVYNRIRIPDLHKEHKVYLQTASRKTNILSHIIRHKDHTYVTLSALNKVVPFKINENESVLKLSLNGQTVALSKTSAACTIYKKIGVFHARNQGPPIYKNGQVFVPLESMIQRFNYTFNWDAETRSLQLLSPILDIRYSHSEIHILSEHPVEPTIYHKSGRIYMDIPFASLMREYSFSSRPKFHSLSAKIINSNTVQISGLNLNDIRTGKLERRTSGIRIPFLETLSKLSHRLNGDTYSIILPSTSSLRPVVSSANNGKKIIIDLPGTLSKLPSFYVDPMQPIYHRIRASQYTQSPAKSRIVIDLKKSRPVALEIDPLQTLIQFQLSSKELAHIRRLSSPKNALKNKVIALDAGHGGNDPGAIGLYKEKEKIFTYDITTRLKRKLEARGARVVMVRRGDRNPSLHLRTKRANKAQSDIFISIHVNSFTKQYANGTETYYYKYKDKQLASALQKSMARKLKLKNNGVKRARLYVLRHSKMPTALVEPAFLTNPKENRLINSPQFRQSIADSLALGIEQYFSSRK